jgi:hypothetical protein
MKICNGRRVNCLPCVHNRVQTYPYGTGPALAHIRVMDIPCDLDLVDVSILYGDPRTEPRDAPYVFALTSPDQPHRVPD